MRWIWGVVLPLQDRLDAFTAEFETRTAPPEVVATLRRSTAELIASGLAGRALAAGARAPRFSLPDSHGEIVNSADLLIRGPLVLTFQRGSWCPYCTMDMRAIEAAAREIRALGASVLAISPQSEPNSRKFEKDNGLSFSILRDSGNAVAHEFGLRYRVSQDVIAVYKGFGNDLVAGNGEDSLTLPLPARYVIGRDGIVAYAEVNADYTRRPDPREWMPVLESLSAHR